MYEENYGLLVEAIVLRAVKDYKRAKTSQAKQEIESFFKSGWFIDLTNVNGQIVLERLKKEMLKKEKKTTRRYQKCQCSE